MSMTVTPAALTDEERAAIIDAVREFARSRLAPNALDWDRRKHFPRDVLAEAGELGLGGIYVRDDVGGTGLRRTDAAAIFEQLAVGDPAIAAYISIHNMVAWMIDTNATEAQRQEWLPRLVTMRDLGAYCLTEPGAGSDAAAITTSAIADGDDYVLTGVKQFISGAGEASVYVVMARTGEPGAKGITAFLVPADASGLGFGPNEQKMGWNAQPTRQVILDEVRVPASAVLGEVGGGFRIAMKGLNGGRVNIAACSLGGAQWALDRAVRYVRERFTFGEALAERQSVVFALADMATELQAARARARRGAGDRRGRARCGDAVRHGQALRDRRRVRRRQPRPAVARRLRIPAGVRHREGGARPARAPDPRGHERDHAGHHRPRRRGSMTP